MHMHIVQRQTKPRLQVGGQFLVNTIMADVIDYDEFLNAARSEAAFSVFATLIPKFVAIPASAVPLALINLLGFVQPVDGVAQVQNDGVHRCAAAPASKLSPMPCGSLYASKDSRTPASGSIDTQRPWRARASRVAGAAPRRHAERTCGGAA